MTFNIGSNGSCSHPREHALRTRPGQLPWRREAIGDRALFGYASVSAGGLMTVKTAIVVGLVAGAWMLATDAHARGPITPSAVQTVAVKKPAPKQAGRPKENSDPMA